jgi:tetratricopeptide (TPR) repeat protein
MRPRKKTRKGQPKRPWRPLLFLIAALAATVAILFAPTLGSGFAYDSVEQIQYGDFIHYPGNFPSVISFRVMGLDVLDFNRPVALASFMFDSVLWQRQPFGYHLTNIVLHLIGTLLVFALIRHVLMLGRGRDLEPVGRDLAAFLAATLFAVHPLVTEAVCEPSNRKDLLAMIFGFTAILIAARHDPLTRRGDLARLFLIALLSLLSVGSKEVGAAFPVILFFYWLLFRRGEPRRFWFAAVGASVAAIVAFLLARFSLEHSVSQVFVEKPVYPDGSLALAAFLVQPRIDALYLYNLLWPAQLCGDYSIYNVRYLPLLVALPVLVIVAAALAWWSRRDFRVLLAVVIMLAGILPASNLMPQYRPAADRYLYIPLVGVVLLVAVGLEHLRLFRRPDRRWLALLPVLIVAAALSVATLGREKVWSSQLAFWEDVMAKNPHSVSAWISLPDCLRDAGRPGEARIMYERAFQTPARHSPWLMAGYAVTLDDLGDHAGALTAARRAVALKPDIGDPAKMIVTLQANPPFIEQFHRILESGQSPGTYKPQRPPSR